jgi:hypothetical protein
MSTMMTPGRSLRSFTARGALCAGALLVAVTASAWAQDVQLDPRWEAWLGCWGPVDAQLRAPGGAAVVSRVCVVPAATTSGVDVLAIADERIVARDRIEATGERRPAARGNCAGWERAEWSRGGRRVYLRAEYLCAGGRTRSSNGLMAISSTGEWLDVSGVGVDDSTTGLRVVRYKEGVVASTLPDEIRSALRDFGPAADMARTAAAAPLTIADVVEASRHVDAAVAEAWLAEQGQGFELDARRLLALADEGLPDRVIDVMVALSNPRVFTVNTASREVGFRPPEEGGAYGAASYGGDYYALYSWRYYGAYAYDYYSPYGFAYGRGSYSGHRGVSIQLRAAADQAADHGRVVNGSGYTGSGTDGGPGSSPSPSVSAGSASGRSTAESGTGSGATRTAHPKP